MPRPCLPPPLVLLLAVAPLASSFRVPRPVARGKGLRMAAPTPIAGAGVASLKEVVGDYVKVRLDITDAEGAPIPGLLFDTGDVTFAIRGGGYLDCIHDIAGRLAPGESCDEVVASPWGEYQAGLVVELDHSNLPDGVTEGDTLRLFTGQKMRVTSLTPDKATLDANAPLAGVSARVRMEMLERQPNDVLETMTVATGCYWGGELAFQRTPGVAATAVGFTDGHQSNPTYSQVCAGGTGHTEAIQVLYDPTMVTYEQLLRVTWDRHNPTQANGQGNDIGDSYRA